MRLGTGALADMDGVTIPAKQRDGHALLGFQLVTQGVPTGVKPLGLEFGPQGVYQVVGEQDDKQMTADAVGFLVVDRSQSQLRLQAAEHRFEVGQQSISPPQGGLVPVIEVGA